MMAGIFNFWGKQARKKPPMKGGQVAVTACLHPAIKVLAAQAVKPFCCHAILVVHYKYVVGYCYLIHLNGRSGDEVGQLLRLTAGPRL
jgi:hypothetical protein